VSKQVIRGFLSWVPLDHDDRWLIIKGRVGRKRNVLQHTIAAGAIGRGYSGVKMTVLGEHILVREETVQWLEEPVKDVPVDIHHHREILVLIVTVIETTFTAVVAAKAPPQRT